MNAPAPLTADVDLTELQTLAGQFARVLRVSAPNGLWVSLEGELGAGKTTFMQALLNALGFMGRVRSPTYPLVESYSLPLAEIHHMDWYRLIDVTELDALGFKEWIGHDWIFVEWSSRFPECSRYADLTIRLKGLGATRWVQFESQSPRGETLVEALASLRLSFKSPKAN
jgi:tRNA threonylcarbamoyladenosine biosynthesis protein TsaE